MGRYVSGGAAIASGGFTLGAPTVFRASQAGIAIPEWARGGWMELWGCGAGGGRSKGVGGHGAIATGLRMLVPAAAVSLSVVIGAAGANGVSGTIDGTTGGATSLSIDGVEFVRLEGGTGGYSGSSSGGGGGKPYIFGISIEPHSGGTSNGPVNQDTVLAMAIKAASAVPVVARVAPGPAGANYRGNAYISNAALFGAGGTGYGAGAPDGGTASPGLLSVQFLGKGG